MSRARDIDRLVQDITEVIEDCGFFYDRMSPEGKQAYDKLCSLLNELIGG